MVQNYPCQPNPCGPHSQCREFNNQAVCSCLNGYRGAPPACRPECVASSDCPLNKACSNQICIDPCKGACGVAAVCQVINHNPICTCRTGMSGDPFTRCISIRKYFLRFYLLRIIQKFKLNIVGFYYCSCQCTNDTKKPLSAVSLWT